MQKIKPIQDLRGIAILMVVLFHTGAQYTNLVSHGNNGVLLFFMVSGFIIGSAHSNDKGVNDFLVFIKKRISRIHFPYFPIVTLFIIMFLITGKGGDYHHDPINIIRNILIIQDPDRSIHPYAWTLVFEMFYYCCFGFLVILTKRGIGLFVLVLSTPALYAYLNHGDDTRNLISSFYNLYFLSGVILAKISNRVSFNSHTYLTALLFAIFISVPFITNDKIIILLSSVAFFYAYLNLRYNIKILEKIGDASYTIYLTHALVVTFGKHLIHNSLLQFVLLFMLSILIGYIYYMLSEKPLTNLGRRILGLQKSG